jgi:hypothetical protein
MATDNKEESKAIIGLLLALAILAYGIWWLFCGQ